MTDVFISYKRRTRSRVEEIADALRALDLDVWFDAALEPGQTFAGEIGAEVRRAKCILVLWTNDCFPHGGDKGGWVVGEASIGMQRERLVTAFLEPADLDPPWNTIHTESLIRWSPASGGLADKNWIKVVGAVGRLVGRPGLGAYVAATAFGDEDSLSEWREQYFNDPLAKAEASSRAKAPGRRKQPSLKAVLSMALLLGFVVVGLTALATQQKPGGAVSSIGGTSAPLSSSSQQPSIVDLGTENVTTLAKTSDKAQTAFGRIERVLTVKQPTSLNTMLAQNGFTDEMVKAIDSVVTQVYPDPVLPSQSHVRILFGPSRTSNTLIPYRMSIYVFDAAKSQDRHAVTVALTDRGAYVFGLQPPPIIFPDGGKNIVQQTRTDETAFATAPGRTDRARPNQALVR